MSDREISPRAALRALVDRFWIREGTGATELIVRDPDGNVVTFAVHD